MAIHVILLAGGSGTRMNAGTNKILLPVAGEPCIRRSARAFGGTADQLTVVCRECDREAVRQALDGLSFPSPVRFVNGGNTRQASVLNGLRAVEGEPGDLLLIHDAARCLVSKDVISHVVSDTLQFGSGIPAVPVTDTLRRSAGNGSYDFLDRSGCFAMQTPQGFLLGDFRAAMEKALSAGFEGTDDAAVMEFSGRPVHLSEGNRMNLKLTVPEDLRLADSYLAAQAPLLRVGHGYDVHRLVPGRKLILCGVDVPHDLGLLGHSDADVALHALMDALLGAAGLGDIGRHFPDTDPAYKGISSLLLLDRVVNLLRQNDFRPVNVDITIVAQQPKLAPHISGMREITAIHLGLPEDQVNIKATTTERLGFEGRMEGISATAVCMLASC